MHRAGRTSGFLRLLILGVWACTPKQQQAAKASVSSAGATVQDYSAATTVFTDQKTNWTYKTDQRRDMIEFFNKLFPKADFIDSWTELEAYRSGSVPEERRPYVDTYYPYKASPGGTNNNGALTAYDRAFYKGTATAASWEARFHTLREGDDNAGWSGHCNGVSAATTRFKNPQYSVARPAGCQAGQAACVVFSPAQIRALLGEISSNVANKFIGSVRCETPEAELPRQPRQRSNPSVMDDCEDINPAILHLSLVNFMGRMQQPLIHDEQRGEAVWNYPIFSYSYTADSISETQASAMVDGSAMRWIHNAEARSWKAVHLSFYFRELGTTNTSLKESKLEYVLELDSQDRVIGGEWAANRGIDSRISHPDFIWMAFEPLLPLPSATASNPHIDPTEVIKIWAESVGLDPNNPFPVRDDPKGILFYPQEFDLLQWGDQGPYKVKIGNDSHGSVFLGKDKQIYIQLMVSSDSFKNNTTVELTLNGQSLPQQTLKDGYATLEVKPRTGINILGLRWTSAQETTPKASSLDREFRFYAM